MSKIQKTPNIFRSVIILILFINLSFYYLHIQKNKEFTFYDEAWGGVCKSYYFDYFIKANFSSNIWYGIYSYDQPMLGNYLYGAVLYPKYLYEIIRNYDGSDYTEWLINKGFYCIDERITSDYRQYRPEPLQSKISPLKIGEIGTKTELVDRYGSQIIDYLNLIAHSRKINTFLLSFAVIVFGLLVCKVSGGVAGILFIFTYSLNSNLINNALFAHTEALFVLLFNLSLLFHLKYFTQNKKKWLLISSVFTGLCWSTKLNAIMLIGIYFMIEGYFFSVKKSTFKKILKQSALYIFVAFLIFTLLHPYIWRNPYRNLVNMYIYRGQTLKLQQSQFHEAYMPSIGKRITKLYSHYFVGGEFSKVNINIPIVDQGVVWLVLFVLGIFSLLKRRTKKERRTVLFIPLVFVIVLFITLIYLSLDWSRYYIHLSAFFIYFEVLGIVFTLKFIRMIYQKIVSLIYS